MSCIALAIAYMRRERPGQTLQATALVHEAYLRLLREKNTRWENRAHFCAIAAGSMRQILVERARARGRLKRAGDQHRITLSDAIAAANPADAVDVDALDTGADPPGGEWTPTSHGWWSCVSSAACRSTRPRRCWDVSPATVKRSWNTAKAWLRRELSGE